MERPHVLVSGIPLGSRETGSRPAVRNSETWEAQGLFRGRRLGCRLAFLCAGREVELDLPFVIQDEARPKRFAAAAPKTCQNLTCLALLDELPRDLGSERPARDALPDDEAAPRLLARLPARAPVGARVLADDLARLGATARTRAELDPLGAELLLVERGDPFDRVLGERGD